MKYMSSPFIPNADIDPTLLDHLYTLEARDSAVTATVTDVSTLEEDNPADSLDINKKLLTNEAKQTLDAVREDPNRNNLIGVAVKLPSDGIFVDVYTYEHAGIETYPNIEDLARATGVDTANVHHLIGKSITTARIDGNMEIVDGKHEGTLLTDPTVTQNHIAIPAIMTGLLTPLAVIIGVLTPLPTLPLFFVGVVLSVITGTVSLYLYLGKLREHGLPDFLEKRLWTDYVEPEEAKINEPYIENVNYGEVTGFGTFAPEDEDIETRTILYNAYVEISIQPDGTAKIPLRIPARSWTDTIGKRAIYEVAPSVDELSRSTEKLLPVRYEGDYIVIDTERLPEDPSDDITSIERFADLFVSRINESIDLPTRQERFGLPWTKSL